MKPVERICGNCGQYKDNTEWFKCLCQDVSAHCVDFRVSAHIYKLEVEKLEKMLAGVEKTLRHEDAYLCSYCKHHGGKILEEPCRECLSSRHCNFEFPDGEEKK